MRIAKYIASCGIGSRRSAEELITAGRVKLNNEIITDLGRQIDIGVDIVLVDEKICEPNEKKYYLLNKPVGYTTSLADPHAKKLISELVPAEPLVWPVGRLDRETSGLIILTNDGDLTQKMTHPKYLKQKEYIATLEKSLTNNEKAEISKGINLSDGPIKPDFVEEISPKTFRIVIHEGRNRIIRRIFEHFENKVVRLERIRVENLTLDNLEVGKFREITNIELEDLKNE